MEVRDINKAVNDGIRLLFDMDIMCGNVVKVRTSGRMTRAVGRCVTRTNRITGSMTHELVFMPVIMEEKYAEADFRDTVLHELLHTVDGCQNHGWKWKELAEKVNRKHGTHIEVMWSKDRVEASSAEAMAEAKAEKIARRKEVLVKFQCTGCGNVVEIGSRRAFARHPEDYECSHCRGKFIKI